MLKKLLPREKGFFTLFQEVAEKVLHAAEQFQSLVTNLEVSGECASIIEQDAKEGDELTRRTFDLLHKTFITPFDRYDIHKLASTLDDVLDLLHTTAQKITIYQIETIPSEIQSLAQLALEIARLVKTSIHQLDSLKNGDEIMQYCRQIIKLRNEAEQLALTGVAKLFEQESDFKNLLKIKEVYESIKRITDKSQNLANIMKGIVLEYA
ncbi:MAG: DUF47 family protein [Gammaproteobacteria bacterium]|nr:DUF47 family protein [Gammaproteobacteria bacterium]